MYLLSGLLVLSVLTLTNGMSRNIFGPGKPADSGRQHGRGHQSIPPQSQVPDTGNPVGGSQAGDCGLKPVDIQFLVDASGSVKENNFKKVLVFIRNFAKAFEIGPDKTQIGVTTYGTTIHPQFWLNTYSKQPDLLSAISQIQYTKGQTYTGKALDFVRETALSKEHGNRDGVPDILVVITDGKATDESTTVTAAQRLHQANVIVFAVGVGKGVQVDELTKIASDPSKVFLVTNFDALTNIQELLEKEACEAPSSVGTGGSEDSGSQATGGQESISPESQIPDAGNPDNAGGQESISPESQIPDAGNPDDGTKPTNCGLTPLDIQFLLDSSGSVGTDNFPKMLDFVEKFADAFEIGPDKIQIGVTTYATNPQSEFWLNTYSTKSDLLSAISKIPYSKGSTYTGKALDFVRQDAFSETNGNRDGVPDILIVFTDGKASDKSETVAAAERIHKENITVFAVGIGDTVNATELETIASDPSKVFYVKNFDALKDIQDQLKNEACEVPSSSSAGGSEGETMDVQPSVPSCNPDSETSVAAQVCPVWSGTDFVMIDGKCIKPFTEKLTWDQAKAACEAEGPNVELLELTSEAVRKFAQAMTKAINVRSWLGGTDAGHEGEWVWAGSSNKMDVDPSWWGNGQPDNSGGNENCLIMRPDEKINDYPCSVTLPYYCEAKSVTCDCCCQR